jgi:hypothetical protein
LQGPLRKCEVEPTEGIHGESISRNDEWNEIGEMNRWLIERRERQHHDSQQW